jgi:hypothetical protein
VEKSSSLIQLLHFPLHLVLLSSGGFSVEPLVKVPGDWVPTHWGGSKPLGAGQAPEGVAWVDADQVSSDILLPWSLLTMLTEEQRQALAQQTPQPEAVESVQQAAGVEARTGSSESQLHEGKPANPGMQSLLPPVRMFLVHREPASLVSVLSQVLWPVWQRWYSVMLVSGIQPLWMKAL